MIYISHKYQGDNENKIEVEHIIEVMLAHNPNCKPVSPIHCFGWLYDRLSYQDGLNLCLALLDKCDIMLVYGDYTTSRGCNAEIDYCKAHGIPYKIMGSQYVN